MSELFKTELSVSILSPENVIFSGKVQALSCSNSQGVLDILPGHSNFMSMIKDEITIHLKNGVTKKIPTEQAIMEVVNNEILILTNVKI